VIGLYGVETVTAEVDRVLASLTPRHASCKPRDRWFEANGIEKPTRLSEVDALTEKTIRETVAGCCSGPAKPAAGKCC
jgi:hypothetical protein